MEIFFYHKKKSKAFLTSTTFESWHVCVVKGKPISNNSMVEGKHHEKNV
jgi:hypothetical protein